MRRTEVNARLESTETPEQTEHLPEETAPKQLPLPQAKIANLWKRIFAALLDLALISLACFALAFAAQSWLYSIGPWGRLLGMTLALLYFGLLNAEAFGGQTVGKRLLKIKAVNPDGSGLGVGQSMLRAALIVAIIGLNGLQIPIARNPGGLLIEMLMAIIVFAGTVSMLIGFVFDQATRRGPHDHLLGSYVLDVPFQSPPDLPEARAWPLYLMLGGAGVLTFLTVVGTLYAIIRLAQPDNIAETTLYVLEQEPDYFSVTSDFSSIRIDLDQDPIIIFTVSAWTGKDCRAAEGISPCDEDAEYIAQTLLERNAVFLDEIDVLEVEITNRIDLGFARLGRSSSVRYPVEDWYDQLDIER